MGVTNSPIADVFVVLAKLEARDDKIGGFVLEKGMIACPLPRSSTSCRSAPP